MILLLKKTKLQENRKFFFFKILKSLKLRIGCQWARLGSNQRPSGYEPPALTAELRALAVF